MEGRRPGASYDGVRGFKGAREPSTNRCWPVDEPGLACASIDDHMLDGKTAQGWCVDRKTWRSNGFYDRSAPGNLEATGKHELPPPTQALFSNISSHKLHALLNSTQQMAASK
jgi:hypothetical protein